VPDSKKKILKLKKKKNPKFLDRLYIPGMTQNVELYDAGLPRWLFDAGATIQVDKNWDAKPGDIITVGKLIAEDTVEILATKTLSPGEENNNHYFFAAQKKDLDDGSYSLVYVVNYVGGTDYDISYTLRTLVKTDLPAGKDNEQDIPGHSNLKFSLSETTIVPGNATKGVTATIQPYPNAHPNDVIILNWGSVIITQQIAGVLKPTEILVSYQDIIHAGDSARLLVWFFVLDLVGNASTPGSASKPVSVQLDMSKLDGPTPHEAGPDGYIDLERLNESPLKVRMFTSSTVGRKGDVYDVEFRAYPPKGGVIVRHKYVTIENPGRPHSAFFDYKDVRAAAEGRVTISFILRRTTAPFELYSQITNAEVMGSIAYLEAPHVDGYPNDHIHDNPEHVIVTIPYYAWRQPDDEITLILRYAKTHNDLIIESEIKKVGPSWPEGSPVKMLFYREKLQKFKGYRPELYYVISTTFTRARAIDLNESLRRPVMIS
jgi:hypothetical protein